MKLECVYHCRFCQGTFPEIVETEENGIESILMYLASYNFMFRPHDCVSGPSDLAKRMKGVIGVADLTGFRVIEEKNAESIHSDNKG